MGVKLLVQLTDTSGFTEAALGVGRQTGSEMHQIPAPRDTKSAVAATHKSWNGDKMGEYVEKSSLVVGHQLKKGMKQLPSYPPNL